MFTELIGNLLSIHYYFLDFIYFKDKNPNRFRKPSVMLAHTTVDTGENLAITDRFKVALTVHPEIMMLLYPSSNFYNLEKKYFKRTSSRFNIHRFI